MIMISALQTIIIIIAALCCIILATVLWCYIGNTLMYFFTRDTEYLSYMKWRKGE
jgi:hypothetical protein